MLYSNVYFLEHGIFIGFKKPLVFVPLMDMIGMTISNVMSRTFDLALESKQGVFSFSMLNGLLYNRLLQYLKRYKKEWKVDSVSGKIGLVEEVEELEKQGIEEHDLAETDEEDDDFESGNEMSSVSIILIHKLGSRRV
jgi:hypothetical protein